MDFTGKVCQTCQESLRAMIVTQNPQCFKCAIVIPKNDSIATLREKVQNQKEKVKTLQDQNQELINYSIMLQKKA